MPQEITVYESKSKIAIIALSALAIAVVLLALKFVIGAMGYISNATEVGPPLIAFASLVYFIKLFLPPRMLLRINSEGIFLKMAFGHLTMIWDELQCASAVKGAYGVVQVEFAPRDFEKWKARQGKLGLAFAEKSIMPMVVRENILPGTGEELVAVVKEYQSSLAPPPAGDTSVPGA